jgi:hypothetical protein
MKTRFTHLLPVLGLFLLAGCDRVSQLEVRTFELDHLDAGRANALIDPYVYGGREDHPGSMSAIDGAITVRETPDNLDKIERVLAEFDRPSPDVRLHFQLIEADGFTNSDPRIASVETELRKLFQFRGYRLAGEAFVTATDGSEIAQQMKGMDDLYEISGRVYLAQPGVTRLEGIRLYSQSFGSGLTTTVNIRPGQTLVLGSSSKGKSTTTLLLTVRAEEATPEG